ncbi:MAG: VanZ family protein, partial [Rhizonema sp. NSF051]|nr:VanZ family protein [Rhizonema sp. NSF051]
RLVIIIGTLYPFNFTLPPHFSLQTIFESFDNSSFATDEIDNILLFAPLGFGLTGLLRKTRMKSVGKVITVIAISATFSTLIEFIQVFLPSRTSTLADILNNTIGGFLGLICFYLWKPHGVIHTLKRIENSSYSKSVSKIMLFIIGYIILSFLLSSIWLSATSLSTWNLNYPLILGNEKTGDRPWRGEISEVNIADRAISENEVLQLFSRKKYLNTIDNSLVASYQFTGPTSFHDLTKNLPELLPQGGQLPDVQDGKGVALSSTHWLETATPATFLSKRIRKTSQFTISTTVATADLSQTGPGRIISISGNPTHRNLTIGQQRTDLELRLRTPITGANGSDLKLNIPRIFADTNPHHIVFTYSGATIRVYVDTVQNSYSLNLLELITKEQKIYYYALMFIPLGICLMLLLSLTKRRLTFYRLLLPIGILLPSLILESVLLHESGKSISLDNLLLSVLFTSAAMLIWKVRTVLGDIAKTA